MSLAYLKSKFSVASGKVFEYRIKEKPVGKFGEFSTFIDWVCKQFSFEINVYNLMRLTNRSVILKRDRQDVLLVPESKDDANFSA
jgi:hypothetical protein